MMKDEWFYEWKGEQTGPVSGMILREKLGSGQLDADTLVWKEGMPGWVPARQANLTSTEPDSSPPSPPHPTAITPAPFQPRPVHFNEHYEFGFGEVLGRGWNLLKTNFWPMFGLYALVYLILSFASNLIIPVFFMTFPILGGFYYYTLKKLRDEAADIETVFEGFKRRFGSLAMLSFLASLPMVIGLIPISIVIGFLVVNLESSPDLPVIGLSLFAGLLLLLTIVSVIVLTITWIAAILCLDSDLDWKTALHLSRRAYNRHPLKLTLFGIIALFLMNLGFIAFFVGVFATGAWITASYSAIYLKAFGGEET